MVGGIQGVYINAYLCLFISSTWESDYNNEIEERTLVGYSDMNRVQQLPTTDQELLLLNVT